MAATRAKDKLFFEIGRTKIPFVSSDQFKQLDTKLISAVTGMPWEDWCKLLTKHGLEHAQIRQGFFAVALQRVRKATIDEVVELIDELPLVDGIKLHVPEVKEGDAVPPTDDGTATT